uniref:Uncharacterized protein n=1 Tax=Ditylenchus dipsaci TaxID=166011 RepID=A0A915E415_9BILA
MAPTSISIKSCVIRVCGLRMWTREWGICRLKVTNETTAQEIVALVVEQISKITTTSRYHRVVKVENQKKTAETFV